MNFLLCVYFSKQTSRPLPDASNLNILRPWPKRRVPDTESCVLTMLHTNWYSSCTQFLGIVPDLWELFPISENCTQYSIVLGALVYVLRPVDTSTRCPTAACGVHSCLEPSTLLCVLIPRRISTVLMYPYSLIVLGIVLLVWMVIKNEICSNVGDLWRQYLYPDGLNCQTTTDRADWIDLY